MNSLSTTICFTIKLQHGNVFSIEIVICVCAICECAINILDIITMTMRFK